MGRKGVSKRKTRQTKVNPLSNDKASGVISVMNEAKTPPARTLDNQGTTPSKDRKKKP